MAFSFTNKRGVTYFLHAKVSTTKTGSPGAQGRIENLNSCASVERLGAERRRVNKLIGRLITFNNYLAFHHSSSSGNPNP
jgi:hypothetical protein